MKEKIIKKLHNIIIDIIKAQDEKELDAIAIELAEIEKKVIAIDQKIAKK